MKNTRAHGMGSVTVREGIVMFRGKLSRHLFADPMISNAFFIEDSDEAILYDPSCGRQIAAAMEDHIRQRRHAGAAWKKTFVVAGHSHVDHANNFALIDVMHAPEKHVYVHESGFRDGQVMNEPKSMFESLVTCSENYFSRYATFPFPYNLLMSPFTVMNRFAPAFTRRLWAAMAAIVWPNPVNGSVPAEPLREEKKESFRFGDAVMTGWKVGSKILLATPGHSPCSVSLLWEERKALLVSDADWIGNPVFMFSSLSDCIESLEKFRTLTEMGVVEVFLPAHGQVKTGRDTILNHLDFRIGRLKNMRDEVLCAYDAHGEKDVRKLTRILVEESPFFKTLKLTNLPKMVLNVHDIVALCLNEAGILTRPGAS